MFLNMLFSAIRLLMYYDHQKHKQNTDRNVYYYEHFYQHNQHPRINLYYKNEQQ